MSSQRPPRDNIVRALFPGPEVRGDGKTLTIRLAPADSWAEIDSATEGHFMERFSRGAYRKTLAENPPKILFQHGKDPQVGEKPIATTDDVGEDEVGPFARGQLLDGLPELIVNGLRHNVYGSSHRFSVVREDWNPKPAGGPHNPAKLPERTITEARLFELGPVTWPAYAEASASLRSMTDEYLSSVLTETTTHAPLATLTVTAAPSVDAGAAPHLEPERRAPSTTPQPERKPPVEYVTRDEKAARLRELRENLTNLAGAFPGVLPIEEQARWDADTKEVELLEADIRAWDARQAKLAEYAHRGGTEPGNAPAVIVRKTEDDIYDVASIERSPDRIQKYRDNALRAAEQMRVTSPRYDQDKSRERLVNLIDSVDSTDREIARRVLTTNSPAYRAAFNRYVKSGGEERGTALAVGVDGTGGYSVPVSFDPTVVAIGAWTPINPFRAVCRQATISGTDTYQALTATAIVAAYATEAAAATEQGPTFARPEFIAKRAHAFVTASYEMAQDRADLAAELGVLFGEAKDTLEENQFSVGTGLTVYPQGMGLKDAYTRVDSVGNDVVAIADVLAVEAALPIRHRMGACWFLSRAGIRGIQAFETVYGQLFNGQNYAGVGNPVNARDGNTGLRLLGYPVYETPSMPWTPTTDDTTWGVLADPSTYLIVDRVGMSVKVIPDMLDGATPSMPTGEIGIYAFWRNTARVLNADGGRQGAVL